MKMKNILNNKAKTFVVLAGVNILIIILLTILSPTFITYGNISAVMQRMSELGMLAIAETIVFISGGFDLSIGAVMALSGAVCGTLNLMGIPFGLVILLTLLVGVAVGAINAFFIVNMRLQPFIVTLATMSIIRSIVYALLKGNVLTGLPNPFLDLGYFYILKIPFLFIILIVSGILVSILLKKTILGRKIFSIGGNENTAFLSGIYVGRVKYLVYCLSGLISAMAGLMFTIRIRAVIPDAGLNAPLEVITAVLIGGTTIYGGKGSVLGSLLGILAMYLLLNGFSLLGLNPFWEVIILGLILITVVGQDSIQKSLRKYFPNKKEKEELAEAV
jgi:ribose transport system permease protein